MKFEKFAVWFTCIVFGFLILNGLFGGRGRESQPEPFSPRKMSQVPRQWPAPAWAMAQEKGVRPDLQDAVPMDRPVRQVQIRLPSWDEGWKPYAVWRAEQSCTPDRPQ